MDEVKLEAAALPKQTFFPTGTCCDRRLRTAMLSPTFALAGRWTCPACGCDWLPKMVADVKLWEPHPIVEVHRGRAR